MLCNIGIPACIEIIGTNRLSLAVFPCSVPQKDPFGTPLKKPPSRLEVGHGADKLDECPVGGSSHSLRLNNAPPPHPLQSMRASKVAVSIYVVVSFFEGNYPWQLLSLFFCGFAGQPFFVKKHARTHPPTHPHAHTPFAGLSLQNDTPVVRCKHRVRPKLRPPGHAPGPGAGGGPQRLGPPAARLKASGCEPAQPKGFLWGKGIQSEYCSGYPK